MLLSPAPHSARLGSVLGSIQSLNEEGPHSGSGSCGAPCRPVRGVSPPLFSYFILERQQLKLVFDSRLRVNLFSPPGGGVKGRAESSVLPPTL